MRIPSLAALVAVTSLLAPAVCGAQSLAEIAAKEKEKRKARKTGKIYTESDLGRSAGKGTMSVQEGAAPPEASPAPPAAGTTAAGAPKEKTAEEKKADDAKAWRDRLKKATDDVTRLQAEADRLQTALNNVSAGLYSASRANTVSQLEETKRQLAAARQSVADLEDEGRKNRY